MIWLIINLSETCHKMALKSVKNYSKKFDSAKKIAGRWHFNQ